MTHAPFPVELKVERLVSETLVREGIINILKAARLELVIALLEEQDQAWFLDAPDDVVDYEQDDPSIGFPFYRLSAKMTVLSRVAG